MPQPWEYCSVGAGEQGWVYRYPLGSAGQPIRRDRKIKGDKDWHAAMRLMDQLGAEGWELVTVAGQLNNHFFFKRPKAEPAP